MPNIKISQLPTGSTLTGIEQFPMVQGGQTRKTTASDIANTLTVTPTLPSFTVAGLPSAATVGKLVYVTDDPTGAEPLFADGLAWRRVIDRTAITDKSSIAQNNLGTVSSGTATVSYTTAQKHKLTVGGAISISFTGWPVSGLYAEVEVELVNGGAFAVSWIQAIKWVVGDGTDSFIFADMGVTLAAAGTN